MRYKGFCAGQKVQILGNPSMWSSHLCDRCPIGRIIFPYYTTILKIEKCNSGYAMTDGNYGWDLEILIRENLIKSNKVVRKEKLIALFGNR